MSDQSIYHRRLQDFLDTYEISITFVMGSRDSDGWVMCFDRPGKDQLRITWHPKADPSPVPSLASIIDIFTLPTNEMDKVWGLIPDISKLIKWLTKEKVAELVDIKDRSMRQTGEDQ